MGGGGGGCSTGSGIGAEGGTAGLNQVWWQNWVDALSFFFTGGGLLSVVVPAELRRISNTLSFCT